MTDQYQTPPNTPQHPAAAARAKALEEISGMERDLIAQHTEIERLTRDLNRATDRCTMLEEERSRYRGAAEIYRDKVVELANHQANIMLLCQKGGDILQTANELMERVEDGTYEPTAERTEPRFKVTVPGK